MINKSFILFGCGYLAIILILFSLSLGAISYLYLHQEVKIVEKLVYIEKEVVQPLVKPELELSFNEIKVKQKFKYNGVVYTKLSNQYIKTINPGPTPNEMPVNYPLYRPGPPITVDITNAISDEGKKVNFKKDTIVKLL